MESRKVKKLCTSVLWGCGACQKRPAAGRLKALSIAWCCAARAAPRRRCCCAERCRCTACQPPLRRPTPSAAQLERWRAAARSRGRGRLFVCCRRRLCRCTACCHCVARRRRFPLCLKRERRRQLGPSGGGQPEQHVGEPGFRFRDQRISDEPALCVLCVCNVRKEDASAAKKSRAQPPFLFHCIQNTQSTRYTHNAHRITHVQRPSRRRSPLTLRPSTVVVSVVRSHLISRGVGSLSPLCV